MAGILSRVVVTCALLLGIGALHGPLACAQQNGGFEQPDSSDGTEPAHWSLGGDGYRILLTDSVAREGRRSLRMTHVDSLSGRYSSATQEIAPAGSLAGSRVSVRGFIKTEGVGDGQAALWVRADGPGGMLEIDNMRGEGATGTLPWTRFEADILVPKEATRIVFGALHAGSGTAWFDGVDLRSKSPDDLPVPSSEARKYLQRALDVMQERSVRRDSINWKDLRAETMRWARGAETPSDTYPALRYAIERLGDDHSFLVPASAHDPGSGHEHGQTDGSESEKGWEGPSPHGEMLPDRLAYVRVPRFSGSDAEATAFADSLHRLVAHLDQQGACGWIVDLRRNVGGNMWPMLAGLGPVLGEGQAGQFVYPDGSTVDWWYRSGSAGQGADTLAQVSGAPHVIRQDERPPVAVLTGERTMSSGEAIAVAFRGRQNARSFGRPSRGLSTSNEGISLSDGATLVLTTSVFADRTGRTYGGPIRPDVRVNADEEAAPSEDAVVDAAGAWLNEQCSADDFTPTDLGDNRKEAGTAYQSGPFSPLNVILDAGVTEVSNQTMRRIVNPKITDPFKSYGIEAKIAVGVIGYTVYASIHFIGGKE